MLELGFSEENIKIFKHFFIHTVMKVLTFIVARRWGECNSDQSINNSYCNSTANRLLNQNKIPTHSESDNNAIQRRNRTREILWQNKGFEDLEDQNLRNQMNHLHEIELRRDQLVRERNEHEIRRAELLREHEQLVQERDRLTQRLEELEIENRRLRRIVSRHRRHEQQLWQFIFRLTGIQMPELVTILCGKNLFAPTEHNSEESQSVSDESEISDSDYEETSDDDDDDYESTSETSESDYLTQDDETEDSDSDSEY